MVRDDAIATVVKERPYLQNSGLRILVRDTKHDYCSSVVVVEIDALGDFASRY